MRHLAAPALLLGLSACGGGSELPPPPNVLLVSLDTTRADALGCYGSTRGATPFLDDLARRGARFERAFSPVPLTLPSHTTMLTGLDPPRHSVRDNSIYNVPEAVDTLTEILKGEGYRTFATVSSIVLLARHGLDQGFDVYDSGALEVKEGAPRERGAREIAQSGTRLLDGQQPFFGFLHFYDPHQPFKPPEDLARRFGQSEEDLYFAELAYVDRALRELFRQLESRGLPERTLIIVTADHGEARSEHGEVTHGMLLHDATQRVPLLVLHPSVPAGTVVPEVVCLADLTPTVLDFLGCEVPAGLDGRSLLPALRGEALAPVPAYLETLSPQFSYDWSPLYGLRNRDWKLVMGPRSRLFDMQSDPGELRDLAAEQPQRVEQLEAELLRLRDQRGPAFGTDTNVLTPEELRQLGGIGYLAREVSEQQTPDDLPDPHDHVHRIDGLTLALRHIDAQQYAQAVQLLEPLVEVLPNTFILRQSLGSSYGRLGRHGEALVQYREALRLHPDSLDLLLSTAHAAHQAGEPQQTRSALERAVLIESCPPTAWLQLWEVSRQLGDAAAAEAALQQLEAAVGRLGPDAGLLLAEHYLSNGRPEDALRVLSRLARLAGELPPEACFKTGELLSRVGRPGRARQLMETLAARQDVAQEVRRRAQRILQQMGG